MIHTLVAMAVASVAWLFGLHAEASAMAAAFY